MRYQKNLAALLFIPLVALTLSACTQTTPSMMNSNKLIVAQETVIDQIALEDMNNGIISRIADYYNKNATGALGVTVTYNPNAKGFGRTQANQEAKNIAASLKKYNVKSVMTETVAVPNSAPFVIINYDTTVALAPANCGETPGLEDYQTGRFIGDYKFGCGVETMFAKQIANPNDLYGNSGLGTRYARREANVIEGYAAGVERPTLSGVETNERIGN